MKAISLRSLLRTAAWALTAVLSAAACKNRDDAVAHQSDASGAAVVNAPSPAGTVAASSVAGGVPAGLGTPLPLKADVQTRRTRGTTSVTLRKTFTRGKDRVHVLHAPLRPNESPSEWLLVQNPNDPRRVSGTQVEHGLRVVIVYREHELASGGMSRDWAEAAALGLKVTEAFETLTVTGKSEQAFGFQFTQRTLPSGHAGRFRELWWSDQAAAPLRWVMEDERGRTEVTAVLSTSIDASLLKDPRERFPSYEVTDLPTLESGPKHVEPD